MDCPSCDDTFSSSSDMKRHHAMKHNESIAGFSTTCTECGDTVIKRVEEHTQGNSFCNQNCLGSWKSKQQSGDGHWNWSGGPLLRACVVCGDEYEVYKHEVDRRATCGSRQCKSEYFSTLTSGENNPNWKGGYDKYYGETWNDSRERIVNRDNNICQRCGRDGTIDGRTMPVHHVVPVREFDDPDKAHFDRNMYQVCLSCHPKLEAIDPLDQIEELNT